MTEKRYSKMMNHYGTSRTYCTGIYDNQNNRELQNSNQVITELNALHEENEQLKKQVGKLKKDIDYYKTERAALFEYLDKKDNLNITLSCDIND